MTRCNVATHGQFCDNCKHIALSQRQRALSRDQLAQIEKRIDAAEAYIARLREQIAQRPVHAQRPVQPDRPSDIVMAHEAMLDAALEGRVLSF